MSLRRRTQSPIKKCNWMALSVRSGHVNAPALLQAGLSKGLNVMDISPINPPSPIRTSNSCLTPAPRQNNTIYSEESFKTCLTNLSDEKASPFDVAAWNSYGNITEEHMAHAWRVYNRASHPADDPYTPPTNIIGRLWCKDQRKRFMENSSICTPNFGIDTPMVDNFGVLGTLSPMPSGLGSAEHGILRTDQWSLLINDAFILGLIHSKKDINLASPVKRSNIWDKSNERLTVFGRELIALKACDAYSIRSSPHAVIATYHDSAHPSFFGFKDYLDAIHCCNRDPEVTIDQLCQMAGGEENFEQEF